MGEGMGLRRLVISPTKQVTTYHCPEVYKAGSSGGGVMHDVSCEGEKR